MQKETLREKFGSLEEQLEKLTWFARQNDLALLDESVSYHADFGQRLMDVQKLTREIKEGVAEELSSQRTISTENLLTKIVCFALEEAAKKNIDLALNTRAGGKISMHNAELIMGAMIPAVRMSIQGLALESAEKRKKKMLFGSATISLELREESDGIFFSLHDDGPGFRTNRAARVIREYISKHAGWCAFKSFDKYGGRLELRLPVAQVRIEGLALQFNGVSLALPKSCVREVEATYLLKSVERIDGYYCVKYKGEYVPLCEVDLSSGLRPIEQWNPEDASTLCILGAADFMFGVLNITSSQAKHLKLMECQSWLTPTQWFSQLCVYRDDEQDILLPYVDGSTLMQVYRQYWGSKK